MPSSSNATNTTHTTSTRNGSGVSSHAAAHQINTSAESRYDPTGQYGYGVGRLLKGAFDLAWETWQGWWNPNPEPSPREVAQRQQAIYVAGLKKCVQQLKPALENVRKNPHDPASLRKMDDLAQHYVAYVNVAPAMELHVYQQQLFQPISEQVERLSDPALRRKLKMLLPVLAIGSSKQENKKTGSSTQNEDEYNVALSQSYYDEKSHFKNLAKSSSNEKRSVQQAVFPAVFNLSALDGANGFTVPGISSNGYLGASVSMAGDINGDSITDLVLGAYNANSGNGTAYVIFGNHGGFGPSFNLVTLNDTNGFTVPGIASGSNLGVSVSTAGDINGDNVTDLILGTPIANSFNGTAYVIFGSRGGFGSTFSLVTLSGINGFTIPSIALGGKLGASVSTAGDINGDTITDLVLGAYGANAGNGTAYVIFGSRGGFGSTFNLASLNGTNGFTIASVALNGGLGSSVSIAGDINGDGITDLVLGAYTANSGNGTAYVIFGSRGGFASTFNLATLNGTNGFTVPGIASDGQLGYSVSTAGDINGDGITDLILGAYNTNSGNGTAYVIFGSRGGFGSIFNLASLNGTNGFTIPSVALNGELGYSVSTAGDINGDGFSDLVLGAYYANSGNGIGLCDFWQSGEIWINF